MDGAEIYYSYIVSISGRSQIFKCTVHICAHEENQKQVASRYALMETRPFQPRAHPLGQQLEKPEKLEDCTAKCTQ